MRRAVVVLVACLLALVAAAARARADDRAARADAALARAAEFLASRQDADGAWRSGVHGSFRDGVSLTPHVAAALYSLREDHPSAEAAYECGVSYLLALRDQRGALRPDVANLHFPVYTAAEISRAVVLDSRMPQRLRARDAWIEYLRARQLGATNGWARDDPEFGGWGYCPTVPRKPAPGAGRGLMVESNLSATLYALAALRAANVPTDDPALADALVFLDRCQNFADEPSRRDQRFDDGGFFFMPGDAARNKAGPAGTDRFGRERYHSYGSTTADGIRAMLACGRVPDHPRVAAAARWLARNFDAAHNAGTFNPDRAAVRGANYFYYCWSVSHALVELRLSELETPAGKVKWAEALTDALLAHQRADGSWANDVSDGREDDPLVATSFAADALHICKRTLRASN